MTATRRRTVPDTSQSSREPVRTHTTSIKEERLNIPPTDSICGGGLVDGWSRAVGISTEMALGNNCAPSFSSWSEGIPSGSPALNPGLFLRAALSLRAYAEELLVGLLVHTPNGLLGLGDETPDRGAEEEFDGAASSLNRDRVQDNLPIYLDWIYEYS